MRRQGLLNSRSLALKFHFNYSTGYESSHEQLDPRLLGKLSTGCWSLDCDLEGGIVTLPNRDTCDQDIHCDSLAYVSDCGDRVPGTHASQLLNLVLRHDCPDNPIFHAESRLGRNFLG